MSFFATYSSPDRPFVTGFQRGADSHGHFGCSKASWQQRGKIHHWIGQSQLLHQHQYMFSKGSQAKPLLSTKYDFHWFLMAQNLIFSHVCTLVNLHCWPLLTEQIMRTRQDQGCYKYYWDYQHLKCKCIEVWSLGNIYICIVFANFCIYICLATQNDLISSNPVKIPSSPRQPTFFLEGFFIHSDPTNFVLAGCRNSAHNWHRIVLLKNRWERKMRNDLQRSPGGWDFVGMIIMMLL